MLNNSREIRDTLYTLKNDFGVSAYLHRLVQGTTNYVTGAKSPTVTVHKIRKMVLLPLETRILYNHNLVPSDFKYGGGFEVGDRECLIDRRDLPRGYSINNDDYVVYAGKRYNLIKTVEMELYYYLHVRETQDEAPSQKADGMFFEHPLFVESFIGEI